MNCRTLVVLLGVVVYPIFAYAQPSAGWSEDFSDGMSQWWTEGGERIWVEAGRLQMRADAPRQPVATAWCRRELPADFELRLDAQVVSSSRDDNNINLFFCFSDPSGRPLEETRDRRKDAQYKLYHELNGYIITFLNDKGTARVRIRRDPGFNLLAERYEGECRAGVTYRLHVRKQGGLIVFSVNDRELLRATDPAPLSGGLLGLRTYRTHLWWDNVQVTPLAALKSTPPHAIDAPAALPPRTVAVGKGGVDGFVATDADGMIHVIYGGKYRTGPAADRLGPEETITDIPSVNGVRIAIDGARRPHVVFTAGTTSKATRSYYTTRKDGRWIPAEMFANAPDFPDRGRAYVADIAVDENAHVLASFWVGRPIERRRAYEDWSFYYRWRSPEGAWSDPQSLSAHWSSTPKVEFVPERGFSLLWQYRSNDWRIAGPIAAGGTFALEQGIQTGSTTFGNAVQNEGADFSHHPGGVLVIAGNKREKFEGPVGIWATTGTRENLPAPVYLGSFAGTKRGSESGLHPVTAYDAATGHAFVCVMDAATKRAVFTVHRPKAGWVSGYTPILPDQATPQGTLRQGPSIADVPGPGVVALVRDGGQQWYLRTLTAEDATAAAAK